MSAIPSEIPAEGADAGSPGARASVFLMIFALVLITLRPFEDLREEMPDAPVSGKDQLTYFAFFALAIAALWLARRYAAPAFRAVTRPGLMALAVWMLLSTVNSWDPSTSLKRAVLGLLVIGCAAAAPLLPRGRAEMAAWIAIAATTLIGLSYFGVLFMPQLAIHSLADTLEPDLAGAWRGVFSHKNVASPVFGFLAYIGLYIAREGRRAKGYAIAAAAVIFLLNTHGKTSTALWLPALFVGGFVARAPSRALAALAALLPPLIMNALGMGAQLFAPLRDLAAKLPFDASFTGRAEIWQVAAAKIQERLIAGRGFDTFWDDPAIKLNTENGWATTAAHAHNGYVDATLSMGLVGLALTLWNFVVRPLADIGAARRQENDPALTVLCAQIWVYCVWVSSLETFLFDRANPVWFLFLFAVFTLRYLATFRTAP